MESHNEIFSCLTNSEIEDNTQFNGMEQCSNVTGLPISLLKLIKQHGDTLKTADDGKPITGLHVSGRIYWKNLKPWLVANKDFLTLSDEDDSKEHWDKQDKKFKALLGEFKLLEARKKVILKADVHSLLETIASAQTALFNSKFRQELPARCAGKSTSEIQTEIDKCLEGVFRVMKDAVEKWK